MITLQYLQELGTFTLDLIQKLQSSTNIDSLEYRFNDYFSSYHYDYIKFLFLLRSSYKLTDKEAISVNKRSGHKLTFVKHNLIDYVLELENYSSESFKEDWFALSTVLTDEEIIELYLVHTVQNMLISTSSTERVLFNASLIQEYFQHEKQ